jgi:hypothetical protein
VGTPLGYNPVPYFHSSPMIFPRVGLWSCLASASAVLADYNITIDDTNAQIQYTGVWAHEAVNAPFSSPSTFYSSFIGDTEHDGPKKPYL